MKVLSKGKLNICPQGIANGHAKNGVWFRLLIAVLMIVRDSADFGEKGLTAARHGQRRKTTFGESVE